MTVGTELRNRVAFVIINKGLVRELLVRTLPALLAHRARNWRISFSLSVQCRCPTVFWCFEPYAQPGGSTVLGSDFRPTRLVTTALRPLLGVAVDPVGTAVPCCRLPRWTLFFPLYST